MINVTRLNGKKYVINADLVEFVEETPDTVITTITGRKVLVKETSEEVIDLVVEYRRRVGCHPTTAIMKENGQANDGEK